LDSEKSFHTTTTIQDCSGYGNNAWDKAKTTTTTATCRRHKEFILGETKGAKSDARHCNAHTHNFTKVNKQATNHADELKLLILPQDPGYQDPSSPESDSTQTGSKSGRHFFPLIN
jgi:hypothetical protein